MSQSGDITPCILFCLTQRPNFLGILHLLHVQDGLFLFIFGILSVAVC